MVLTPQAAVSVTEYWTVVGASAGIATAAATTITVLLNVWWRWRDRKEPDWAWLWPQTSWRVNDPRGNNVGPHLSVEVHNAGDGTAYRCQFEGVDCVVKVIPLDRSYPVGFPWVQAVIRPGDAISLMVECDPKDWEQARVVVRWKAPPTWRKWFGRKRVKVRLHDISPPPEKSDGAAPKVSSPSPQQPS